MLASRFETRNRAFGGAHAGGHSFLRETSTSACGEHFVRNGVLDRESFIGGPKTPALARFVEKSVVLVRNGLVLDFSHARFQRAHSDESIRWSTAQCDVLIFENINQSPTLKPNVSLTGARDRPRAAEFARPASDLSCGATVDDIVATAVIVLARA